MEGEGEGEGRSESNVAQEIDPYKFMNIVLNPDGSLTRPLSHPLLYTSPRPVRASFKDVTYDPAHNVWLRLYRPHDDPDRSGAKLPVVVYIHGGGFILFSADMPTFHAVCGERAEEIPAIVVSVEYRLAPENRLPAAYNDAIGAIEWVRAEWTSEPWLRDLADPTRVFIMGTSAGGNIAFHVAMRIRDLDLSPVRVAGVIMNQPFFGGVDRTESEIKYGAGGSLPLVATDVMWELALPEGTNRDHEYSNPESGRWLVGRLPKCMVCGFAGDPVVDRQKALVRLLKAGGVDVVERFEEDGFHGIDYIDPEKGREMFMVTKKFILETK